MPFTLSHPAIVLPLISKRLRLSATGLIIGSMIPDFEYFIRMRSESRYSHTLAGMFWFDLPMALVLCFVYHLIVRNSLFDNLPFFLKERVAVYKNFQWTKYFSKNWIVVCICILIGAASHIMWDAFAHDTLFFVEKDPELSTVMKLGTINLAGYKFLQLASSIIGLVIVVVAIISLKKRPCENKKIDYGYWLVFSLSIATVMFIRFVNGLSIGYHRRVIVSAISSVIIALILTPLFLSQQDQQQKDYSQEETQ
ncbi:MAG: DUF4184 family protein [Chitinophagales bacterium]